MDIYAIEVSPNRSLRESQLENAENKASLVRMIHANRTMPCLIFSRHLWIQISIYPEYYGLRIWPQNNLESNRNLLPHNLGSKRSESHRYPRAKQPSLWLEQRLELNLKTATPRQDLARKLENIAALCFCIIYVALHNSDRYIENGISLQTY